MLNRSKTVLKIVPFVCKEFRRYKRDVALIGVPFGGGQGVVGVQCGPNVLRHAGLVRRIEELGRTVHDYGDIDVGDYSILDPEITEHEGYKLKNARICGDVSRKVAAEVEKGATDGHICVILGGDHSIATGSIFGHKKARADLCVLWIDAHNDLNTYETTNTGNLHGMPLSFLVKGLPQANNILGYEWTKPCLSPFDIVYIGLRDTDPGEFNITQKLGIRTFSMHDVDRYGISAVVERAIELINPRLDRPIHVSYDIDALDPSVASSTGTAVYGGLTLREGLYIGEYVNKLGLLGALDLVEVNPKLKSDAESKLTVQTALSITEACLGKHRSGYVTKRHF